MLFKKEYFICLLLILTITACSHRPTKITASRPLLTEQYTNRKNTECTFSLPANLEVARQYMIRCQNKQWNIIVERNYISGLGDVCAYVNGTTLLPSRRLCRTTTNNRSPIDDNMVQWYFVKNVLSNISVTE